MRGTLHKIQHVALYASGARRAQNVARFGPSAPRPHQQFQITPAELTQRYWVSGNGGQVIGWWQSGQVLAGDWDRARHAFSKARKYKACVARFRDGKTWEESGVIDYMMARIAKEGPLDQCQTRADVMARYTRLDTLWQHVKSTGRLPDRPRRAFEGIFVHDDILVHIDRDAQLLFGNQGFHRLAIAKIAGLETISVRLGVVHPEALCDGPVKHLQ